MGNIILKTKVQGNYLDVMNRFDRDLFEALKPKVGRMDIVKFTGSQKGDVVHLRFLSPIRAEWISEIIDDGADDHEAYFTDIGIQLPYPLKFWKHIHKVQKISHDTSYIIDDMTFQGPNKLITWLLYPALYLAFYPRKWVYRSYFKKIGRCD